MSVEWIVGIVYALLEDTRPFFDAASVQATQSSEQI